MVTMWLIWISFKFRYLIALVFSNLNGTEMQKITVADCVLFFLHFIGITHNLHFHLYLCVSDSQSPDLFLFYFFFCVVILCGALFWQFH